MKEMLAEWFQIIKVLTWQLIVTVFKHSYVLGIIYIYFSNVLKF